MMHCCREKTGAPAASVDCVRGKGGRESAAVAAGDQRDTIPKGGSRLNGSSSGPIVRQ